MSRRAAVDVSDWDVSRMIVAWDDAELPGSLVVFLAASTNFAVSAPYAGYAAVVSQLWLWPPWITSVNVQLPNALPLKAIVAPTTDCAIAAVAPCFAGTQSAACWSGT